MQDPATGNRLMDMTGAQLRAFLAVAEHGGFNSAAEALNVSQPTISKAVKSLERKLGPLFDRVRGRSATLSPVGKLLKDEAADVIQMLREIERKISAAQDDRPVIRVAVGEYLYDRSKAAVSRFLVEHKDIGIKLEMVSSREAAFRALRLGDLDLLFVSQFRDLGPPPRVASPAAMKIYHSPLDGGNGRDKMLLPMPRQDETRAFVAALSDMGLRQVTTHVSVPNYSSIKSMCIAGQGHALLFEDDARAEVAAGRLAESVPGAVAVDRGCYFFGESALLKKLAEYLVAALD